VLSNAMNQFDIDEVKTPTCKVNFRGSKSLTILDEEQIDEKYKTEETVVKINKNQIKKDINNGNEVNGAEITFKRNLQIK
jgi:hypothetical protein